MVQLQSLFVIYQFTDSLTDYVWWIKWRLLHSKRTLRHFSIERVNYSTNLSLMWNKEKHFLRNYTTIQHSQIGSRRELSYELHPSTELVFLNKLSDRMSVIPCLQISVSSYWCLSFSPSASCYPCTNNTNPFEISAAVWTHKCPDSKMCDVRNVEKVL